MVKHSTLNFLKLKGRVIVMNEKKELDYEERMALFVGTIIFIGVMVHLNKSASNKTIIHHYIIKEKDFIRRYLI